MIQSDIGQNMTRMKKSTSNWAKKNNNIVNLVHIKSGTVPFDTVEGNL